MEFHDLSTELSNFSLVEDRDLFETRIIDTCLNNVQTRFRLDSDQMGQQFLLQARKVPIFMSNNFEDLLMGRA
jgi:hypothetical protein